VVHFEVPIDILRLHCLAGVCCGQFGDFTYVEHDATIEVTDYPED